PGAVAAAGGDGHPAVPVPPAGRCRPHCRGGMPRLDAPLAGPAQPELQAARGRPTHAPPAGDQKRPPRAAAPRGRASTPDEGRTMSHDAGGDALDAVLAAVGGGHSWETTDHRLVANHPRYPREGRLYV